MGSQFMSEQATRQGNATKCDNLQPSFKLNVKPKENLKLPLLQWWEIRMQSNSFPVTQSLRSQKEKDMKTHITDIQPHRA